MYDTLLVTFLVACGLAAAVTPMAIRLAPKIGAMDIPKDSRRMHDHAMPRFGGLAIFAGSSAAMLIFLNFDHQITTIVLGGVLIYILGIIDDLKDLDPKIKFAGQTLVANTYVYAGHQDHLHHQLFR